MKLFALSYCLFLSACSWGQNIVSKPIGFQRITQPARTEFSVNRFESTRYADQFPGSDIGARVNNAYADCSSTGCRIRIPAGTYAQTTAINIGTSTKPALIECDPGVFITIAGLVVTPHGVTQLNYTGPATNPAVSLNAGVGSRITGCTLNGNGTPGSIGLMVGGSNGNILGGASDLDISNFDVGLEVGNNVYISRFDNLNIHDNVTSALEYPASNNQSGENISFFGGEFNNHGPSYSPTCINLQGTPQEIGFHNVSFDQCGITLNSLAGLDFINTHWENPGGPTCDDFLTIGPNAASSQITIVGGTMYEDFGCSTRMELISVNAGVHMSIFGGRYLPLEAPTGSSLIHSTSPEADFTVDGALISAPAAGVASVVGGTQRGSVWVNPFTSTNALTVVGFGASVGGSLSVGGNLNVSGAKNFKIDHPLDPLNKYLYHSSVESPDMLNLYNGIVTLNSHGEAWVSLPNYFGALNDGFRYQLTAIGSPAPRLYVAEKVSRNRFKIAGGKPGMEVSWQVTGIRQDPYAKAHRVKVEEQKPKDEQGHYLHPELFETLTDGVLKVPTATK